MNKLPVMLSVFAAFAACAIAAEGPRVERRKPLTANVGVVSVGLDTYWKQCPGLYEDMLKKAGVFEKRVASHDVKVTSFGISSSMPMNISRPAKSLSMQTARTL